MKHEITVTFTVSADADAGSATVVKGLQQMLPKPSTFTKVTLKPEDGGMALHAKVTMLDYRVDEMAMFISE